MRIKELAEGRSKEEDYITILPPSPADLLLQHPRVAARLSDGDNLPVASPLNRDLVSFIRKKITLRPNRLAALAQQSADQAMQGLTMNPAMMMAGLRKHACIHACAIPQTLRW